MPKKNAVGTGVCRGLSECAAKVRLMGAGVSSTILSNTQGVGKLNPTGAQAQALQQALAPPNVPPATHLQRQSSPPPAHKGSKCSTTRALSTSGSAYWQRQDTFSRSRNKTERNAGVLNKAPWAAQEPAQPLAEVEHAHQVAGPRRAGHALRRRPRSHGTKKGL